MSEEKAPLASEGGHWYAQDGTPVYEISYADPRKGMRAVKLGDARKLDLIPGVSSITRGAAAPGLEAWKARQILESALTLPMMPDEVPDDYAKRVIADAKAQSEKARDAGTALHATVEHYLRTKEMNVPWDNHIAKLIAVLEQYGIDIHLGKPEHCFASPLGYGGKLDWHSDKILMDFKTTESIAGKKRLAWDEHIWQLAAYDMGIPGGPRRLINVFIGVKDCEVRIHEWSPEDAKWGWLCFRTLLDFWHIKNRFGNIEGV